MTPLDAERIALQLRGGTVLLLQRCGRSQTPGDLQRALGGLAAVIDGRSAGSFADWDPRRPTLASASVPLVVLLDVASARRLLREAPQTASWAGGVQLPYPATIRGVRTDEELEVAERAWARVVAERPELTDHHRGADVAFDLGSRQVFFEREGVLPIHAAQEALDEGVVYLTRVPS